MKQLKNKMTRANIKTLAFFSSVYWLVFLFIGWIVKAITLPKRGQFLKWKFWITKKCYRKVCTRSYWKQTRSWKKYSGCKNTSDRFEKNKTTESSYELICDGEGTSINMLKSVEASLKKVRNLINQQFPAIILFSKYNESRWNFARV